ncbi:hypothetical protein D3C75_886900 [compost metagenome]
MGKMAAGANPLSAMVLGFNDVFFFSACIAVAGVVISLILRKPKVSAAPASPEEQQTDAAMMMGH